MAKMSEMKKRMSEIMSVYDFELCEGLTEKESIFAQSYRIIYSFGDISVGVL